MPQDVESIFRESGALMEGHFLLSSGQHSPAYWEKFRILQYPYYTEKLCRRIVERFRGEKPELVAGPTVGGIILAYEVAHQLGLRGIFAEREDAKRAFRRGFSIAPGERVLVVDDVLTTGGSVKEVIEAVKDLRGLVVGVGVLIDRSNGEVNFGVPLFSCHKVHVPTYSASSCPLCAVGVPLIKPGSTPTAGQG
ncbi:orotate phosphoribosyltransferase [Chloroflexota bacterium]